MTTTKTNVFDAIENVISSLKPIEISNERTLVLQPLIAYIQEKAAKKETIRLITRVGVTYRKYGHRQLLVTLE